MPDAFENNLPRRTRFGRGASLDLPKELRRLGRAAPFIVTDAGVAAAGLLKQLTAALDKAGMGYFVFGKTEPEPPFSCVAEANASARAAGFAADAVVALGGGSVIDTAKLVAATLSDGRQAHLLA